MSHVFAARRTHSIRLLLTEDSIVLVTPSVLPASPVGLTANTNLPDLTQISAGVWRPRVSGGVVGVA